MSIKEYQERVDDWMKSLNLEEPYWKPLEIMARLSEETGEVARELNHLHGAKKVLGKGDINKLKNEMADIIITLICLANSHNINLDGAMEEVFDKINSRDTKRYKKV
jgi:NTP pyrophosphatase (non-canonical NTP hydrolase)